MSTNNPNLANAVCINTMLRSSPLGAANLDEETISKIMSSIRNNQDVYDDVDFTVGNAQTSNIECISGIRILFAVQSEPLCRMLFSYDMSESLSSNQSSNHRQKVYIPDVTPTAFHSFKQYCYGSKLCLFMDGIVDLLYIANKYLVSRLSEQCEAKILAECQSNIDMFYKVILQFQRYSPSTFDSFLTNLMSSLQLSSHQIIKDNRFTALQPKFAAVYVRNAAFLREADRYQAAWTYAQSMQNAKKTMRTCFVPLIDFMRIELDYLTIVIQKDAIFTDSELLSIITTKIEQNVKAKISGNNNTRLLK